MPSKRMRGRRFEQIAKGKREDALGRLEFRYPSEPRAAAAGATSFPVKADDPAIRKMIDEALALRKPGAVA